MFISSYVVSSLQGSSGDSLTLAVCPSGFVHPGPLSCLAAWGTSGEVVSFLMLLLFFVVVLYYYPCLA